MTGGAMSRAKGARWASAMCDLLHRTFPAVTLTAPGQVRDHGDAANLPFIAEFKNHQAIELGEWSTQVEKAAIATGLYRWALFVKRRLKSEARDGWMVVPNWFGMELLDAWTKQRADRFEAALTDEDVAS